MEPHSEPIKETVTSFPQQVTQMVTQQHLVKRNPKLHLLWKLKPASDSRHGPSLSAAPHLCDGNADLYWEILQLHMCKERGQVSSQLLVSIYTFTGNVDYLND